MALGNTGINEAAGSELEAVRKAYLPAVSQDLVTPDSYWQKGAVLPANMRNTRFYTYATLYDGEADCVADNNDFPITFSYRNWFAEVANFYRDFLMNEPPKSTSPLQDMLNNELRRGIVHLVAHGVCIFAVEDGTSESGTTGEALIEAIDPRYFYPLPPETDDPMDGASGDDEDDGAIEGVEVYAEGATAVIVRIDGTERTYAFKGEADNWGYPSGELDSQIASVDGLPDRRYYAVALAPEDGFYGSSIFRDMLPAVGQHTELMSSYLSQLKISANILTAKRAPGASIRTGLPTEAAENQKTGKNSIQLAQLYGTLVEGVEELSFVSGVVSPESFAMPLDRIERSIYSIAAISPTLAGQFNDQSILVASGVAFEKSFIRTAAKLNEIVNDFLPLLETVLAAAGAPAEVTWVNPLRALDDQQRAAAVPEPTQAPPVEAATSDESEQEETPAPDGTGVDGE